MPTTFPALANNFGRTTASAHTAGSGTFVLSTGSRTELLAALAKLGYGAPSPSQPLRFTAFKVDESGVFTGNAADLTIYSATGMTSETLTGCTAVEGTTDQDFPIGSAVECLVTAGTLAGLATAVNTLGAGGYLTADGNGSQLTGIDHGNLAGLADDDHSIYHTDARALAWLGTRTTSDLPEGSNQYHTTARVNTLIASAVGVSVQAYSDTLAGLAGATYASGALLGGDGSGVPVPITLGANLTLAGGVLSASGGSGGGGSGTVTTVSVVTANGVSGTVANATTTPAITITLGAITPTSVAATGTVTGSNLSGTNTGDQTITLTGDVTGSGTGSFVATIGAGKVTASMLAGSIPASKLVQTDLAIAQSQVTGLESALTTINNDVSAKADSTTVDSLTTTVAAKANTADVLLKADNLASVANTATARSNLGLAIGTDVLAPTGDGSALTGLTQSQVSGLTAALAAKAPLASPSFTGTVSIGSLAGILKGTAGAVGVATAGTDYLAPNGSAAGLSNLPLGDTREITFLLAVDGNALAVGTNLTKVGAIIGHAGTITKWKCVAGENPSGGGFTFDLKKNGVSIFSAPIAVAANTTAVQSGNTFAVATGAENDLLTVDCTAAGTGVKHVNLTLFITRTGA